jgi:hypothetical protein
MIRPVSRAAGRGDGADPAAHPPPPAPFVVPLRMQAQILGRLVAPTREGAEFVRMRLEKDLAALAAMAQARDPAEAMRLWSATAAEAAADWAEAMSRITLRALVWRNAAGDGSGDGSGDRARDRSGVGSGDGGGD